MSGMADGQGVLRKIAFQIGDRFFRFAVNPESMVYSRPHRTTAVKTKSRIVIEDFQSDIPTVTIGGTTGFNPTGVASDRGVKKIAELKKYLKDYAAMGGNGAKPAEDFYFHDFTNMEHYVVHLSAEGVTYSQDVNSPLTHRYEIKFNILREASEPSEDDIASPEIGNRFPSLPIGSGGIGGVAGDGSGVGVGSGAQDSSGKNAGGNSGTTPYDPSSGSNVYNKGTQGQYIPSYDNEPINPQAPSPSSYSYGQTGLGYAIGYYLRPGGVFK